MLSWTTLMHYLTQGSLWTLIECFLFWNFGFINGNCGGRCVSFCPSFLLLMWWTCKTASTIMNLNDYNLQWTMSWLLVHLWIYSTNNHWSALHHTNNKNQANLRAICSRCRCLAGKCSCITVTQGSLCAWVECFLVWNFGFIKCSRWWLDFFLLLYFKYFV